MGKGPEEPEPTAAEKANAKVSVQQWNEYVDNWHKPIKDWAQGIAKDKTAEMDRATGITNADLAQQTSGAEKRLGAGGMNPNSGRAMTALSDETDLVATAGAGAKVKARQGVEDSQLHGFQQVANIGMGQKTEAIQGIGDIARQSTSESLAEAWDKQQRRSDTASAIGGMAGIAAGVGVDQYDQKKMKDYTDSQGGSYLQNNEGVRVKPVSW